MKEIKCYIKCFKGVFSNIQSRKETVFKYGISEISKSFSVGSTTVDKGEK